MKMSCTTTKSSASMPLRTKAEVGFSLQRIFTHDVVGFDLASQRFMRHLGDAGADTVIHQRRVDTPCGGEFLRTAGR